MKAISDSYSSESPLADFPARGRTERKEQRLPNIGARPGGAPRFAPTGSGRSWGVLCLAFLVMAGTGVIINVLTMRADEDRQSQRSLVQLEADAREMDALEWRTIFKGQLDGDLSGRLERIRSAMDAGIGKLRPLEPGLPQLHAVADKYKTYSELVDEEFRFLADGKIKEAQEVDARKVDPAFEDLHQAIVETENAFDKQASHTLALVRAGTFLVLLAAIGFVATLFWHYHQRRRAGEVFAAEQRVLNLLRAITEGTSDAIFAKDREGRYLMINTSGARLVDRTPEEVIGLDDTQLFSEETGIRIIERDRAIMRAGETRTDEDITTTVARLSRVYLTTKGPLYDSAGAIIGLFGVARDITERKRAEEALAAQVLRYRTLMETSTDSIYVIDEKGDLQEANTAFLRRRGYTAAEMKGLNVADWDARNTREQLQETMRKLAGSSAVFETRHRCKDGSLFDVEVCATSVRIGGKSLFFVVTRDISERKRVERAQRESQLRYETLVQSIDGIVWEADPQTFLFTFVSKQAERILGYPLEQWFEGPSFWPDHMHPDDRDWAVKYCVDATARGEDHQLEYRMISADGRMVWLNDIVTLHIAPDQSVILRGLMVDITERKWEEALLKGQRQVLELIATGASLPASLSALARVIEAQSPEMLCSVLLLDDDGMHLLSGAAPSMPDAFTRAIDGVAIGANVGSCGTAAFRREAVFVEDIAIDPLWANYRDLALSHGLRACWSTPIFDAQKKLLGTFAIYYRQPGLPTALHIRLIDRATQTAAIAISRQRAGAALRESEARTRLLIKSSNIGLWDWDLVTTAVFFSPEWKSQLGYTDDELPNRYQEWESRLHPEDRAPSLHAVQDFREGRRRDFDVEFRLRHKDGSWRSILTRADLIRDAAGQPLRMLGCHIDITERKREEEKLRESETRFRQIAENIDEIFWITDLKGSSTIYISPAYERISGRSCESLYAEPKSWRDHIHPEDRPRMEETFASDPGSTGDYTYRIVRPDGSIRWIRDRGFPVRDESGEVVRFAGIAEDITASKGAEEELQQVNEQLRVLSRRLFQVRDDERRHLARELHDEIGQALTAVKINLDSIEAVEGSAQSLRLKEASTILDKLLWQVRQISLDLHSSLIDDLGLAPALRSLLDQQARRAGLRTQFCAAEPLQNLDPGIQTTGFRIAQEAITNVLRHAKAQSLSVHLQTEGGKLRMKIVDDGMGFSPIEIERRARQDGGFGLMGMRERAALVGGRVQIISSTNKGTRVEVSLPLNAADKAPQFLGPADLVT